MITAEIAREKTNNAQQILQDKAQIFVNNELHLIENRILEAATNGQDTITYWWSKSCFVEAETQCEYVYNALKTTLTALGYTWLGLKWDTHGIGSLEIKIGW